jgi:hypothetical protein
VRTLLRRRCFDKTEIQENLQERSSKGLFARLCRAGIESGDLVERARVGAVRSVNTILTSTHWLIRRRIVEHEQSGAKRAEYGEELLKKLSRDLRRRLGGGFSDRNLEQMRLFLPELASFAESVCEI